jgi:hypothetical protein
MITVQPVPHGFNSFRIEVLAFGTTGLGSVFSPEVNSQELSINLSLSDGNASGFDFPIGVNSIACRLC